VEHTVTEAVPGLDLVEWQLRVASGEALPLSQDDIRLHGHAIEARVCAEDPERDFLPSAGELRLMQWPAEESVRVDAGFATGDVVPASYDSLLGKVIAWAPERTQAAARLAAALGRTYCVGVHTNEKWLSRVLRSPHFLEVRHSIALLQESAHEFAGPREAGARIIALAALAAHGLPTPDLHGATAPAQPGQVVGASARLRGSERSGGPWDVRDGFSPNLLARIEYKFAWHGGGAAGHSHTAEIGFTRGKPAWAAVDALEQLSIEDVSLAGGFIAACIEGGRLKARYVLDGAGWTQSRMYGAVQTQSRMHGSVPTDPHIHLWIAGEHFDFVLEDPRLLEFSTTARQGGLTTPLPGVVATVAVEVGQAVKAGAVLMMIEAMKMEHSITAPYDGTVAAIHFARGDRVPEGSELLELAPAVTA
jgi:3-methylcrotonyl-CoA carboxylase alpha subunit